MKIWRKCGYGNESKKTKEGICGSRELCGMWMLCKSFSARGDCLQKLETYDNVILGIKRILGKAVSIPSGSFCWLYQV